jgi:lysophospholipase L1-like esterase
MSRRRKFLWSILVVTSALDLPELFLRLIGFERALPRPPIVFGYTRADSRLTDLSFFVMPDRHCFFNLRPRAQYVYKNTPMDIIDRAGFRGPPMQPDDRAYTVACLGDSLTFGMCVSEAISWPRQLEGLLRERFTGKSLRVLNAGVIGFTAYQGLQKYRWKVRQYRRQVTVIMFCAINDQTPALDDSDPARAARWESTFDRDIGRKTSWVWSLRCVQLLGQSRLARRQRELDELSAASLRNAEAYERGESYRPRLSYLEFEQCLRELIYAVRRDSGVPVIVNPPRRGFTEWKYPQVVELSQIILRVAREESVALVDANLHFKSQPGFEDTLFRDLHHPNARGDRLLAEMLTEVLVPIIAGSIAGPGTDNGRARHDAPEAPSRPPSAFR